MEFLIIICLAIIVFALVAIIGGIKKGKELNKKRKELVAQGMLFDLNASHVNGLPIAENVSCYIKYYADRIEISASGTEYNIAMDRITDICTKTEMELQQQYVSSAGGAVAGALMFGAVGAAIGGRTKKKENRKYSHYFIITYMKDDEVKYLGFDVSYTYKIANIIVNHFKSCNSSQAPKKVEL